ncbi:MAG TPA: hypothetical protein VJM33_17580, partial [Microthrixaceae bacterium]|nr:hypothetical protein [Microthrixaceae bacterium]
EFDLLESSDAIADSGTLAYYDPITDVINVRGDELTAGLRVTLVHELTHALQDQHFGVESLVQNPDSEASAAARAVIEGDAANVEQAYVETELTEEEVAEYEEENAGSIEESEVDLGDVPAFLTTSFSVPYFFGPTFVALFGTDIDSGSLDAELVDGLLDRTPLATGHLFDPLAQLDVASVATVDSPELGSGEAFDEGTFGAVSLFGMLAEHLDPVAAMDAVDGWRGDAYRADTAESDESGQDEDEDDADGDDAGGDDSGDDESADSAAASDSPMCIAADIVMATEDDAAELRTALDAWRSAMPAEAGAEVDGEGQTVSFRSCDPGAEVTIGVEDAFADALSFPVARLQIAYGQVLGGVELETSICVGDRVVREFDLEDLASEELTPDLEERLTEAVTSALRECAEPR